MKKIIALLLALVLCLSMAACGKSKAVKEAESLITAIGAVTADSGDAIAAADRAYSALSVEDQAEVENYATLTLAKAAYAEALIAAIGEVTVDSEGAVTAAENAYNGLNDEEKALVQNHAALLEAQQQLQEVQLRAALACEWVNVNDMDSYNFDVDGTGTHDGKSVEYSIDLENMLLLVTEGVTGTAKRQFAIDLENKTPRLVPKDDASYYVEVENYEAIAQAIRAEYVEILTGYEYWSNTRGLNYVMFGENGGGFFLLSGVTLGLNWEWVDNNTIKMTFEYSGTKYSNVVTIINTTDGPRLVNDQFVVQFNPKNKLNK